MITFTIESSGSLEDVRSALQMSIQQWQEECEREAQHQASPASLQVKAFTSKYPGLLRPNVGQGQAGTISPGSFHQPQRPRRPQGPRRSGATPPMPMMPVQSSILSEIGYDSKSQELCLIFVSGWAWLYHGVPPSIYQSFTEASSLGRFYNSRIKGVYRSHRL